MDILERVTSFAIAMFLLSLIVEKLANFWKLHGPEEIRGKQSDPDDEKVREMSISTATLVAGLLVAFVFKADAIQILRSQEPQQVLGWDLVYANEMPNDIGDGTKKYFNMLKMAGGPRDKVLFLLLASSFIVLFIRIAIRNKKKYKKSEQSDYIFRTITLFLFPVIIAFFIASINDNNGMQKFWAYLSLFAGIVISGAGISFGSKFWHDLLDTLFEVKNLWKHAKDEETYNKQSAQELQDYLLSPVTDDVIALCLEQHGKALKSISGVTGISIGTSVRNGRKVKSLHVHLKETNIHGIANELIVDLPKEKKIKVPVEVIENVGETRVSIGPGSAIKNSAAQPPDYGGTFGCVLKDRHGFRYALTCSHVLDDGRATNHLGRLLPEDNVSKDVSIFENGASERLGTWYYGYRNDELDVALIRLENDFQNIVNGISLKSARPITKNDSEKQVQLFGAKSSSQNGVIASIGEKKITYKGDQNQVDQTVTLQNLIFLADDKRHDVCKTISQPGDSGAVVFDRETKEVLGMIVAGDEKYSYAMPMTAILKLVAMELA